MKHKKRVIFYLIDGARPDVLSNLLDSGDLPHIKTYFVDQGSYVKGTTCFPSTTGPAYLPFLTGKFPGDHHITGIRWFDKPAYFQGRWARDAMRSYCGYEAKYFNEDMDDTMPSLMETYDDSYNIYNMITKGVKEENDLTKDRKTKLYFRSHFKHEHHVVDEYGHEELMNAIEKDFKFIFAVFPSIDWDSHTYHYEDDRTRDAYKIVDRSLAEVVTRLKEQGTYEDTMIIMASDHGLTSTHSHLDLGSFFKKQGYRVLEYPSIWTLFPKVAVFISGNSFATLSFLDKEVMYDKESLMDKHGQAIDEFLKEPAIDFIAMRNAAGHISIITQEGEALVTLSESGVGYKAITANPFGLDDTDKQLTEKEAFDYTFESDYPDSLVQCQQLFASHRSGDIVVSAHVGYDLRDFWEIPEHKGSHGSLHKDHMHIPILTNKPGVLTGPMRSTEVYQIIRDHLDQ
mgnify:CR=1 FL=1